MLIFSCRPDKPVGATEKLMKLFNQILEALATAKGQIITITTRKLVALKKEHLDCGHIYFVESTFQARPCEYENRASVVAKRAEGVEPQPHPWAVRDGAHYQHKDDASKLYVGLAPLNSGNRSNGI